MRSKVITVMVAPLALTPRVNASPSLHQSEHIEVHLIAEDIPSQPGTNRLGTANPTWR